MSRAGQSIKSIEAFQVAWTPDASPGQRSAFVKVTTEEGITGYGEASPMLGGLHSLGIVERDLAPELIGADPLDHAVHYDRLLHKCVSSVRRARTGALRPSISRCGT